MNQNTKQRIVGTVVLLAVALIFLPIIFDGEGSYQRPVNSRIPEPPVIPVMPTPDPVRPILENPPVPVAEAIEDLVPVDVVDGVIIEPDFTAEVQTPAPTGATDEAPVPEPVDTVAAVDEPPSLPLDEQGLPMGWSVRLASFAEDRKAQNLLTRLMDRGYRAYTRQINTSQGAQTAVYVGPQMDRAAMDNLRRQLQQEFNLNGMVVRFEIEPL